VVKSSMNGIKRNDVAVVRAVSEGGRSPSVPSRGQNGASADVAVIGPLMAGAEPTHHWVFRQGLIPSLAERDSRGLPDARRV